MINMTEQNTKNEFSKWIIDLRRYFHMHPELSYQEFETQKKIMSILDELGIENKSIAGSGVLGLIQGDKSGKTIALRADMDALSINEKLTDYNKNYISTNEGVMHACGHDGHMAILLGAAKLLKENENKLAGKIKLIFQPAEEIPPGGAIKIISEGVLDDVNAIVGMHLFTNIESGNIFFKEGILMASHCKYDIVIKGKSGHHFKPEINVDPIQIASKFISSIQTDLKNNFSPLVRYVFGFGTISGGKQFNQTPDEVKISGSYRVLDKPDQLATIEQTVRKNLDGLMESHKKDNSLEGAQYTLDITYGYPSLINSTKFTQKSISKLKSLFSGVSSDIEPVLASEDFARYLEKVPGTFIFLGAGNSEKGLIHENHSNKFDIDEYVLVDGANIFFHIANDFLNNSNNYI